MRKRILSILLACSMLLPCAMPVCASEATTQKEAAATTEAKASENKTSRVISNEGDSTDTTPIGTRTSYYNLEGVTDSPDITAESAYVLDATTGAILYSKSGNEQRYPASITKVMTALLTIENCNMDDIVDFTESAVYGVEAGSSSAGIPVGAKLTVEETLYAMMLVSANEAGAALAEHVAGSVEAFAQLMTERAKALGCTNTNFTNPHGLPDENHVTTAHDMALILRQALKYDDFRKIAGCINYTIPARDSLPNDIDLWNHAKILRESTDYYYEYAEGAKTGFTQAALNTLVTYAKKDDVELVCVILRDYGADHSYYDTKALFKWAFEKIKGIKPLSDFDVKAEIESMEGLKKKEIEQLTSLNLQFASDYYVLVPTEFDGSKLTAKLSLDDDLKDGCIGEITIYDGETEVGKTPVTYDTTDDAGIAFTTGNDKVVTDELQTADVDGITISFKSIFFFIVKIILCFVLVCVIMYGVRLFAENQKRQAPGSKRSTKRPMPNNTSTTRRTNSGNNTGRTSFTERKQQREAMEQAKNASSGSSSTTNTPANKTTSDRPTKNRRYKK